MTSTWKGPSDRDDPPGSQGARPDENQLDLFEIPPPASIWTEPSPLGSGDDAGSRPVDLRPAETLVVAEHGHPERAARGIVELGSVETLLAPARDVLDVGVSDSDDLRRLEESIRWLMNAGTVPLPRIAGAAPRPPVTALSPLDAHDDDDPSLLLDPDTLFTPRTRRRSSAIATGAAKVLLVSAIAAPTAYLVASWAQFPGIAAPSDPAAVAAMATPQSGEEVAATAPVSTASAASVPALSVPALAVPAPRVAPALVEIATTLQAELATVPQPAGRSTAEIVVASIATGPAAVVKAQPEPPSAATQPGDSIRAPMAVPPPPKPALRQEEIAMMVERGRVLFEAGDLASARLFFRRAANAGDAAAAIAMGATYDPEVLMQHFIRGIEADAQEAQRWYEKAREMGQRVEMLAQRR